MEHERTDDLRDGYDRVAPEYAARLFGELADKPLDRRLLDRFAERVRGAGPVCDLGCGPGQVARYLHGRGVDVFGLDLSPGMLAQARRLNPEIAFATGDMRSLDAVDGAWGGIAAFYAIVHTARAELVPTLGELRRVLRPGGLLLLAFHLGQEIVHRDEFLGAAVSLDFVFFGADEVERALAAAGFAVEETIERDPYPDVEYPSRRAYVFARKPG